MYTRHLLRCWSIWINWNAYQHISLSKHCIAFRWVVSVCGMYKRSSLLIAECKDRMTVRSKHEYLWGCNKIRYISGLGAWSSRNTASIIYHANSFGPRYCECHRYSLCNSISSKTHYISFHNKSHEINYPFKRSIIILIGWRGTMNVIHIVCVIQSVIKHILSHLSD